jgi:hypothetical protein
VSEYIKKNNTYFKAIKAKREPLMIKTNGIKASK